MRRVLGSVLAALLLGGALSACGSDQAGSASDEPAPSASASPTKGSSAGAVEFELVQTITATGGGGALSQTAVPLPDDGALEEFVGQFESDSFRTQVLEAARAVDVLGDELLYGAVVALGCDSPDEVAVTSNDAGLAITTVPVPSPKLECFAAMTTVALVLVPRSAVG
jgi:hypothetical protein